MSERSAHYNVPDQEESNQRWDGISHQWKLRLQENCMVETQNIFCPVAYVLILYEEIST